jgi:hypothetical protein
VSLFHEFYTYFTDDIEYKIKKLMQLPFYKVPNHHLRNQVLIELDNLFVKNSASMIDHDLPKPDLSTSNKMKNRLLAEELAYDSANLRHMHDTLANQLTSEQRHIYDVVLQSVY